MNSKKLTMEEFSAEAQVEYDRISLAEKARYPVNLHWVEEEDEGDGYWFAYHPDWGYSTCSATGDTVQEAVANLALVRADLMVHYAEQGRRLPVMSCPPWEISINIQENKDIFDLWDSIGANQQDQPIPRKLELRYGAWSLVVRECPDGGGSFTVYKEGFGRAFACSREELTKVYRTIGAILGEEESRTFSEAVFHVEWPEAKEKK